MKKARKYIVTLLLTLLLLGAAAVAPTVVRSTLPEVIAHRVTGRTIEDTVECSGVIEPRYAKDLYVAAGITVGEVYVRNGQRVNAGDPLFSVDKTATVSLWEAAQREKNDGEGEQVSRLLDGLIEDYFTSAMGNMFSSFSDGGGSDGRSATSELLVLVPDIVTASAAGVVANVAVEDGAYADGSAPLLRICDVSALFVRCELPESFASALSEGLNCTVTGDAFADEYTATLKEISPVAKTASGGRSSIECVAEIDFPDEALKAGYTADMKIILSRKNKALTVPYSAVNKDENGEFVWILYGSRAYRRSVVTGVELDDCVEISGVEAGALVVSEADGAVKAGGQVRIKKVKQ
ncbi:MAG: efflux RND transporter periplasmic adaptor subunit [Clostridia bacterium]|nr:efflux RND transporter periplasmic adaptor subunit [Clostridia bacterium]MBR5941896.1 efflux RND transporter periplasmic adaptor subunit [Clostridia bacterium]